RGLLAPRVQAVPLVGTFQRRTSDEAGLFMTTSGDIDCRRSRIDQKHASWQSVWLHSVRSRAVPPPYIWSPKRCAMVAALVVSSERSMTDLHWPFGSPCVRQSVSIAVPQ